MRDLSRSVAFAVCESLEPRLLLSAQCWSDLAELALPINVQPVGEVCLVDSLSLGSDSAFYNFTAQAGGKVKIVITGLDPDMLTRLSVYNATGRRLCHNAKFSANGQSALTLTAREGSTYFIRLDVRGGDGVRFELSAQSTPRDDVGNTPQNAKPIVLNKKGLRIVNGKINYAADIDVLAVKAGKTGVMEVDLTSLGAKASLLGELEVLDSLGQAVVLSSQPGKRYDWQFNVRADQTYYLSVSAASGQGRYRLAIANVNSPAAGMEAAIGPQGDLLAAGQSIQTRLVASDAGLHLLVLGTDGDDAITMSRSAEGLKLSTQEGSCWFGADIAFLSVYGFDGNDVIRLDHTLGVQARFYGGSGSDQIYKAGPAEAYLFGQAGDDFLVSLSGAGDIIAGGEGYDSFWADGTDVVQDAGEYEKANSLHLIDKFYQPWTNNPASALYVQTTPAGESLEDPTTSYSYQNFVSAPLFADGPQYNDIAQGMLGDCYLLATISSLVQANPAFIKQVVAPLGDGTYVVRFFQNGKPVYLRIDADLPMYSSRYLAYAQPSLTGEIWVSLIEKAYAYFRYGANSYGSLNGGWMAQVHEHLTGNMAMSYSTNLGSSTLLNLLAGGIAAGKTVTVGSRYWASGPIVPLHAYMVQAVNVQTSTVMVYNPWGIDGRSADANPCDGLISLSASQVQQYFSHVVVGLV